MDAKRTAGLAGVVGIFSVLGGTAPEALFGSELPAWLPTFGTIGETTTLYIYGITTLEGLFVVVLAVGTGYYAAQRMNFDEEYRRFAVALAAGTTIPLVVAWLGGMVAFALGAFGGFSAIVTTALVVRLFATVSLPVIVGMFAGAALEQFSANHYAPPDSDETDTDRRVASD